jgi:Zn-dependent protease with chaperone function
MRPSRILKVYYGATLVAGLLFTFPVAQMVQQHELGARGAAILTLCWNVLFIMVLPLVMDWAESRYFKARFMQLEEVAKDNPELAAVITQQCEKLSIPGFRFAVIDTNSDELFSYGLWRSNPRVVLPTSFLTNEQKSRTIPSIEAELTRFASQDHTFVFLVFTVVQVMLQHLLLAYT